MTKTALIVVDMQNDFITGTLALKNCPAKEDAADVIGTINSLIKLPGWDLIVFTVDWHPSDHISFITNVDNYKLSPDSKIKKEDAKVTDKITYIINGSEVREQIVWPAHCVQNTWGAELHQDLQLPEKKEIVQKGVTSTVDSYSAFYDNNKSNETRLRQLLQDHGIVRNFVCGVATDVCVNATAVDSNSLGFQTLVVEDACRGVTTANIQKVLSDMDSKGIKRINSAEVGSVLMK